MYNKSFMLLAQDLVLDTENILRLHCMCVYKYLPSKGAANFNDRFEFSSQHQY